MTPAAGGDRWCTVGLSCPSMPQGWMHVPETSTERWEGGRQVLGLLTQDFHHITAARVSASKEGGPGASSFNENALQQPAETVQGTSQPTGAINSAPLELRTFAIGRIRSWPIRRRRRRAAPGPGPTVDRGPWLGGQAAALNSPPHFSSSLPSPCRDEPPPPSRVFHRPCSASCLLASPLSLTPLYT